MDDLIGKIAVVTGAASGIGRGCALALASAGCRVVAADINEQGAQETAQAACDAGGTAMSVQCDVGAPDAFDRLRDTVLSTYGDIDIVMNNAGIILSGHPEDIPVSEWSRVLDINLMSVVRSNAAFLPLMLARGSGHIVNTASFAGIMSYAFDRLPYAASKAAVFQLSEGLALYLRPKGIGVTVLCPGPVATNIMKSTKVWTDDIQVRGPGPEFKVMTADAVGELVVDAIRRNLFFLPTHTEVRERLIARASDFDAVLQDRIDHPDIIPVGPLRRN